MTLNITTGVTSHTDSRNIEGIVGGEGRNLGAFPVTRVKFPAVVATAHPVALDPAVMEGNPAVGADIPQGEGFPILPSPDKNRFAEHFFPDQFARFELVGRGSHVPEIAKEAGHIRDTVKRERTVLDPIRSISFLIQKSRAAIGFPD